MNANETTGVDAVCPPSIRGKIARVEQSENSDTVYIVATDVVDIDVVFLEREGITYKIVGRRGCFEKHGLDAGLVEGLPVMVWVRPAWCHVLIQPYDRKPVVWR